MYDSLRIIQKCKQQDKIYTLESTTVMIFENVTVAKWYSGQIVQGQDYNNKLNPRTTAPKQKDMRTLA